jgi:hypothetical protein
VRPPGRVTRATSLPLTGSLGTPATQATGAGVSSFFVPHAPPRAPPGACCVPLSSGFPSAAASLGSGTTTASAWIPSDARRASFSSGTVATVILASSSASAARFSLPADPMLRAFSFCSSFHLVFGGTFRLLSRWHAIHPPSGFFSLWSLPTLPGLGPASTLPAASPFCFTLDGGI